MSDYHHAVIITNEKLPETPDKVFIYDFNKNSFVEIENTDSNKEPFISLKRKIKVKSESIVQVNDLVLDKMHLTNHTGKLKDVNTIVKMVKNGELDYSVNPVNQATMYIYTIKKSYPYNTYNTFFKIKNILVNMIDLKTLIGAKLTSKFAEIISRELSGTLELEYEKTYLTMILFTKKKYYTLKHDGKIDVKGLEIVRRDWSDATKEMVKKVLNYLLTYNESIAIKHIMELFKKEVERFYSYNFTVEEVAKVQKLGSQYKSKNLPQVTASEILKRMGYFVQPGMEVSYVTLKLDAYTMKLYNSRIVPFPHKPGEQKFTRVIPVDIIDTRPELMWSELKKHIDIEDVIDTNIINPLGRVLSLFGYSTDKLWKTVTGRNQQTLSVFISTIKNNPLMKKQKV